MADEMPAQHMTEVSGPKDTGIYGQPEQSTDEATSEAMGHMVLEKAQVGNLENPKDGEAISVIVQGKVMSVSPEGDVTMEVTKMDRVPGNPPALGSGERFHNLVNTLSKRPGVTDPKALAAAIGRKKYGNSAFNKMAANGKPGY